jgi:hypothetical protein
VLWNLERGYKWRRFQEVRSQVDPATEPVLTVVLLATPPGVDNPEVYRHRSGGVILPRDADWLEATKGLRQAFATPAPEKTVAP